MASLSLSQLDQYILNKCYPIGTLYWSITNNDPSTFLGGVWERIKDRFVLAVGDTYLENTTGGEATVTLTERQMPTHTHYSRIFTANNDHYTMAYAGGIRLTNVNGSSVWINTQDTTAGSEGGDRCGLTESTGGNQPHNNLPPYVTAYCWKWIG